MNLLLSPEDLAPGKIDGYVGLESSAEQFEAHVQRVLADPKAGGDASREQFEKVRPMLSGPTRVLEYYVATASKESCKGLVPKAVELTARLGTILLTPNLYIPSLDFAQEDDDEQAVSHYIHQTSRRYMRERPTLLRLALYNSMDGYEDDPYVRRTISTVAGFILWQCEEQRYQEFIDIRTESVHEIVKEWNGTFPKSDPPHDIVG
ncbi:MAG: hypothetical protein ABIR37_00395 [Candidatus Saccharimonadales bacterium]